MCKGARAWGGCPQAMIILCVRWYPRYRLSLRDLVELVAELSGL